MILATKGKTGIDSCGGVGAYALIQKDFRKMTLAGLMPLAPPAGVAKSKVTTSDESVYRTTAKALAELYKANEVEADDKIGDCKVEK